MHRALILVDLQNDFMPGGALGIPSADEIVPPVNFLMQKFERVYATLDWHPRDHVSFAQNHPGKKIGDVIKVGNADQILWPVHCVQKTKGAELHPALNKSRIEQFFYKGTDQEIDSYSAFFDNAQLRSTGLGEFLKEKEISSLYLCGLATEYCVLYSAQDAVKLGFDVSVIKDCCRAINLHQNDEQEAWSKMKKLGIKICSMKEM